MKRSHLRTAARRSTAKVVESPSTVTHVGQTAHLGQQFLVGVDNGDIVAVAAQHPGQMAAHLAGSRRLRSSWSVVRRRSLPRRTPGHRRTRSGKRRPHFCNLTHKYIHLSRKPQIAGKLKNETYALLVDPSALRRGGRRSVRPRHVADADDKRPSHRLGNLDQQEHAAARNQMRRPGDARGGRHGRLLRHASRCPAARATAGPATSSTNSLPGAPPPEARKKAVPEKSGSGNDRNPTIRSISTGRRTRGCAGPPRCTAAPHPRAANGSSRRPPRE